MSHVLATVFMWTIELCKIRGFDTMKLSAHDGECFVGWSQILTPFEK